MKKYLLIVLLIVTTVSLSQTRKNVNVGLLVDFISEDSKDLFSRLKNEVKAGVGEDLFKFAQSSRSRFLVFLNGRIT